MVGEFVMTENELMGRKPTPDSVGMGSYTVDSHNVQRYITPQGYVQNEGDIGVALPGPYQIAYGSLVPKRGQADNLLVPVSVSSSHIAFGSIRMEPVFMVLAHSAATAAAIAIDREVTVQDVPYPELRARPQPAHRLGQDVGGRVAQHVQPVVGPKVDRLDARRCARYVREVTQLAIDAGRDAARYHDAADRLALREGDR